MSIPLVSVVMPVYNGQTFLREAIESILAQNLADFELIIVNDGSTDETGSIIDHYHRSDHRVRSVNREHQGESFSRNLGVRLAKSEYIACMDADDIAIANRLELQIGYLTNNQSVAALGGAAEMILSDGTLIGKAPAPPLTDSDIKRTINRSNCFAHSTVMMRRSAFLDVGGYREAIRYAEDYDLWLRLSERYEMANLPEVLLRYRIHHRQESIRGIEQQVLSTLAAQISSRVRISTGVDPILPNCLATRELLSQFGITEDTVNRVVFSRYEEIISLAHQVSLPKEEKEYFDEKLVPEALAFGDSVSQEDR